MMLKKFSLYMLASLFCVALFTSCEKNDDPEDDTRFSKVADITTKINGENFYSRTSSIDFIKYDEENFILPGGIGIDELPEEVIAALNFDEVPHSAIISIENVLGDQFTFHTGSMYQGIYKPSGELIEELTDLSSVVYRTSPDTERIEYSSRRIIPAGDAENHITIRYRLDENLTDFWMMIWFSCAVADESGNILLIEEGEGEIKLPDSERQKEAEYFRGLREEFLSLL